MGPPSVKKEILPARDIFLNFDGWSTDHQGTVGSRIKYIGGMSELSGLNDFAKKGTV